MSEYIKEHYKNNKQSYLSSSHKCRTNNPIRGWCHGTLGNHRKKIIVNITTDELEILARKTTNCIYCGLPIIFNHGIRGKVCSESPTLDRINNDTEININNIQIICHKCNNTKGNRTHKEFIEYCDMIHNKIFS